LEDFKYSPDVSCVTALRATSQLLCDRTQIGLGDTKSYARENYQIGISGLSINSYGRLVLADLPWRQKINLGYPRFVSEVVIPSNRAAPSLSAGDL
jgi:hypothetical protein